MIKRTPAKNHPRPERKQDTNLNTKNQQKKHNKKPKRNSDPKQEPDHQTTETPEVTSLI